MKQPQTQTLISAIQNEEGKIVADTVDISNAFHLFYQKLYASQDTFNWGEFQKFLSETALTVLTESARERLGACITLGEVEQAIRVRVRVRVKGEVSRRGRISYRLLQVIFSSVGPRNFLLSFRMLSRGEVYQRVCRMQ